MEIKATIEKISYTPFLNEVLQDFDLADFNINQMPTACLVHHQKTSFAISKWVSPKRTRSYPYERVYNTLGISKKITVIPIIKDEGKAGDRDYLQWDTVSLMSLLDVYVILGYYDKAEGVGQKITNQQFDNTFIIQKIKEIQHFHSSALHWNLKELGSNFDDLLTKAKSSYAKIEEETGVKLHDFRGIDNFKKKIGKSVEQFKTFSRDKAEKAQAREILTKQPKEALSTATKAKITITNYLGGAYFFTVDEVEKQNDKLFLIEAKHSKNAILPSKSDVKDGLLKLILYTNFENARIENVVFKTQPILKLTSEKLKGNFNSNQNAEEMAFFLKNNDFTEGGILMLKNLFSEAQANNFTVIIQESK